MMENGPLLFLIALPFLYHVTSGLGLPLAKHLSNTFFPLTTVLFCRGLSNSGAIEGKKTGE